MRKPPLHRIDKTSVDPEARMADCAACGRTKVEFNFTNQLWRCYKKNVEYRRAWDKRHRPEILEAKRNYNKEYSKSLQYALSMLAYWEREVKLRAKALVPTGKSG